MWSWSANIFTSSDSIYIFILNWIGCRESEKERICQKIVQVTCRKNINSIWKLTKDGECCKFESLCEIWTCTWGSRERILFSLFWPSQMFFFQIPCLQSFSVILLLKFLCLLFVWVSRVSCFGYSNSIDRCKGKADFLLNSAWEFGTPNNSQQFINLILQLHVADQISTC